MPETVEKMHVLVAEQERFIKELMAKDQASSDDVNRISFHIGFLFVVDFPAKVRKTFRISSISGEFPFEKG